MIKFVSTRKAYLIFGISLALSPNCWAIAPYLDSWKTLYPDSKSGDIRCQLCHLQREGNEPWNAYGNDIRRIFDQELDPNSRTIEQAILAAQELNSDQDSPATSNLSEIQNDQQPAWKDGQTNPAFNRNYFSVGNFFPPITVDPFPTKISSITTEFEYEELISGLVSPVVANKAPIAELNSQIFVADQTGIVWRVRLSDQSKSIYLDLRATIISLGAFVPCGYDERGLIGFAFHPNFSSNGLVYIHTSQVPSSSSDFTTLMNSESADHQSVIIELKIGEPGRLSGPADIVSQRDVLRVDQPQFNHNGGGLVFDSQNYLYIGLGYGGNSNDQGTGHGENGNGGDPSNPLGAILRIDPLGNTSNNGQYGVPSSNPFIDDPNTLDEIFAYGFRNPWKLYFDQDQQLFSVDVGQNDIEEINAVVAGGHYGWNTKEGQFFFYENESASGTIGIQPPEMLPNVDLINPIFEYDHDEGISISGGQAYQGNKHSVLRGKHIFSDFSKRLFIGDPNDGSVVAIEERPTIFINSVEHDGDGDVYLLGSEEISTCDTINRGKVLKITSPGQSDDSICLPIKSKADTVTVICL